LSILQIGMPQMAVRGLSENWLFRQAGAVHWEKLCTSVGVDSGQLLDTEGRRVYASFVAIYARYAQPTTTVVENQRFGIGGEIGRFGQSIFFSRYSLSGEQGDLELKMATKFVARLREDGNDLVQATIRPVNESTAPELEQVPDPIQRHRALRDGPPPVWTLAEYTVTDRPEPIAEATYEPTPYIDFNGAGLFYFASYPAVSDALERRLIMSGGLAETKDDWAISAGTVAREVYYFGNLEIGDSVIGSLLAFEIIYTGNGATALSHMALRSAGTGKRLAEVYTAKALEE